jgi:tRNA U34 2-thiouridine synthase MnmA/TrmU
MKAIALLSGGLDSALAVRIILEQGIEVEALKFTSIFCNCDNKGKCYSEEIGIELNIPVRTMFKGDDYLEIIKNPPHGRGSGVNACIDCRIYMLKKAKEYAESTGASFIFTGEVLGQRPMSQHREALNTIEKESGLEGKLLRPLCAKYLPETEAELNGWVNREKMLSISGRSRKVQLALAKEYDMKNYSCAAGGCLLTDKSFAEKTRDFIEHNNELTMNDLTFLKYGRHFRDGGNKIVIGRNESENRILANIKKPSDIILTVNGHNGPVTVFQGEMTDEALNTAAVMTASYSDAPPGEVEVFYWHYENDRNSVRVISSDKDAFTHMFI